MAGRRYAGQISCCRRGHHMGRPRDRRTSSTMARHARGVRSHTFYFCKRGAARARNQRSGTSSRA